MLFQFLYGYQVTAYFTCIGCNVVEKHSGVHVTTAFRTSEWYMERFFYAVQDGGVYARRRVKDAFAVKGAHVAPSPGRAVRDFRTRKRVPGSPCELEDSQVLSPWESI
jgi:hypothetical protein